MMLASRGQGGHERGREVDANDSTGKRKGGACGGGDRQRRQLRRRLGDVSGGAVREEELGDGNE